MFVRSVFALLAFVLGFAPAGGQEADPAHPLIREGGAIAPVPEAAAERPRAVTAQGRPVSVVFDVTNVRGIDRMARLLNLYADQGVDPSIPRFAIVLHGEATTAALSAAEYEKLRGEPHPQAKLLQRLAEEGVELFVCSQALAAKKLRPAQVAPQVRVAVSAMNVLIHRQMEGAAYLPFH